MEENDKARKRKGIKSTMKSLSLIFNKLKEKYHNFLTWQQVVKCQKCGKVIGVCGVSYGQESDLP